MQGGSVQWRSSVADKEICHPLAVLSHSSRKGSLSWVQVTLLHKLVPVDLHQSCDSVRTGKLGGRKTVANSLLCLQG